MTPAAEIERQVQEQLLHFDAFDGDVDDVLSAFLLLQFQLKEPHHKFVQEFLGPYLVEMQTWDDPALQSVFQTMDERKMMRRDIDLPDLVIAFKTVQLGLTGLWATEGPPFTQTARVLKLQMKLFSEGLKAGEAYEV